MIKTNGQSTRAREIIQPIYQLTTIDRTHRLFVSSAERDKQIASFKAKFENLSPATRRVLLAVKAALPSKYDAKRGYRFAPYVNRTAIGHQLGRAALVPYDIRMLRTLASKQFVIESKRALPRKQCGDIWLGAGAEFVYSIPADVLFCLLALDVNEKERFTEQAMLGADRAAQEAKKAAELKKQQELERHFSKYSYTRQPKPRKQSWFRKFLDLFK